MFTTGAHTPYGQWQVYRQRHLMIGTSKAGPPSYQIGQRIVGVLVTHLPESSARVTRGPDAWRLASLLTSRQIEVVLLTTAELAALRDGSTPFEAFGATRLAACSSSAIRGAARGTAIGWSAGRTSPTATPIWWSRRSPSTAT